MIKIIISKIINIIKSLSIINTNDLYICKSSITKDLDLKSVNIFYIKQRLRSIDLYEVNKLSKNKKIILSKNILVKNITVNDDLTFDDLNLISINTNFNNLLKSEQTISKFNL